MSKDDIADKDAALVVDVKLADFTDAERTLFTSEIHVEEDGETESLHVQLIVEQDPEDDETVAIRRWFPHGHERAPSSKQIDGFAWRYLSATRGVSAASIDGRDSSLRTLLGSGTDSRTDLYWDRNWYVWNNAGDTAFLRKSGPTRVDRCEWGSGSGVKSC